MPNPITRGYEVKFETIVGTGADLRLRSLLDRQQFHDPSAQAEALGISPAQWPLFGLLWPSARVLADTMQSFDLLGKRILEIGCGLALASLVVHRRRGDITASDCHPLAASFLLENLLLNRLPAMKYQSGDWSRANPGLGRFDLIIGSDVLYDRGQPEALSQFIARHSAPTVEVMIADPDRGNQAGFNRMMGALGYSHTQARVSSLPGGGGPYKGRLHRYRRGAMAG